MSASATEREIVRLLQQMSNQLGMIEQEMRNVRSILKSGQSSAIREIKTTMLRSKLRSQIYELCDGERSVRGICNALGKTPPLVSRYLKELEDAGLVMSEQRGKERFYFKVI